MSCNAAMAGGSDRREGDRAMQKKIKHLRTVVGSKRKNVPRVEWRDTSLERVAIRKSQLLNGEPTEDTEKVEDASHKKRDMHYCYPRVADVSDEEEQPFSSHSVLD